MKQNKEVKIKEREGGTEDTFREGRKHGRRRKKRKEWRELHTSKGFKYIARIMNRNSHDSEQILV